MKNVRICLGMVVLGMTMLFSCNKEKVSVKAKSGGSDSGSHEPEELIEDAVFSASVEDELRTALNGSKIEWVAGDKISILWNGGSTTATAVNAGSSSSFPVDGRLVKADSYYAVYPSDISAAASASSVSVTIPSEQSGSFSSSCVMLAMTDDYELSFKNLCGLIRFSVSDESVSSVSIRSIDGTALTGTANLIFSEEIPTVSSVTATSSTITVPVSGSGTYYAAVLPGTTFAGFYFDITYSNGAQARVFSANSLTVPRGTVKNMGDIGDHIVVNTDGSITVRISSSRTNEVVPLTRGAELDFTDNDIPEWDLDYDFFSVSEGVVTFRSADGLYRLKADYTRHFLTAEAMKNTSETATLNNDGSGALWIIGGSIGKPCVFDNDWWESNGMCMSQVSDKVYQITLTAGQMAKICWADLKVFHQKGWGGEYKSYSTVNDETGLFSINSEGNITAYNAGNYLNLGDSYQFEVNLASGKDTPRLNIRTVSRPAAIKLNNTTLSQSSSGVHSAYMQLTQNNVAEITVNGYPVDLVDWFYDPCYLRVASGEKSFRLNVVTGYYRIELNGNEGYVRCQRVKSDGSNPTIKDGHGLWLMGKTDIAELRLSSPIGDTEGSFYCLAEVENMKFRFKGKTSKRDGSDVSTKGIRMNVHQLNFKYFGQNGWGWEIGNIKEDNKWAKPDYSKVVFTTEGGKFIHLDSGEIWSYVTLEENATYVFTIDLSTTATDGIERIDFYKE